MLKEEANRLNLELSGLKDRVKENKEKIKLNNQLPYLVANIVEVLEVWPLPAPGCAWLAYDTCTRDKLTSPLPYLVANLVEGLEVWPLPGPGGAGPTYGTSSTTSCPPGGHLRGG